MCIRDRPEGDSVPDRMVARVAMEIAWTGADDGPGEPEASTPIQMDVLIERADTASPVITAWGSAGEGPRLERYENAVSGQGRDPITPSSTPMVTDPSASGSESTTDESSSTSSSQDQPSESDTSSPSSGQQETNGPDPSSTSEQPQPTSSTPESKESTS